MSTCFVYFVSRSRRGWLCALLTVCTSMNLGDANATVMRDETLGSGLDREAPEDFPLMRSKHTQGYCTTTNEIYSSSLLPVSRGRFNYGRSQVSPEDRSSLYLENMKVVAYPGFPALSSVAWTQLPWICQSRSYRRAGG